MGRGFILDLVGLHFLSESAQGPPAVPCPLATAGEFHWGTSDLAPDVSSMRIVEIVMEIGDACPALKRVLWVDGMVAAFCRSQEKIRFDVPHFCLDE